MLANLEDLLEEINNAQNGKEHEFNGIVEVFVKKGFHRNEIEDLIDEAWKNLLIKNKYYPIKETQKDDAHAPQTGIKFILSIQGFEYLTQIRIKKSIELLDYSIKNFNASSDKYSKDLIAMTEAIIVFTVIVAAIPLIEKINQLGNLNSPIFWIIGYFIMVLTIAVFMSIYFKKKGA